MRAGVIAGWTFVVVCAGSMLSLGVRAAELDGEVAYNNHCRKCHSMKVDDHRLGPSLAGIVGKPAEQASGYTGYSGGLKGLTWDEATLDTFIADPAAVSSSTNMIIPPVKDAAERKAIIDFLKSGGKPE
ncbi:MAG: c-type cytochrome [Hyphomicrobium sp.]